ncbi:MAG: anti-sigma factor [Xanthobacteraceae bacterium]
MTDIGDHGEVSGDELLAAEYALGVLTGPERVAAQARMAREHTFAVLVAAWEARFTPWAAEIAEVPPPPQVWERIAASIPAAPAERAGFWQSIAVWRGFAAAGVVGAAACLGALLYFGTVTRPPLIATIDGGGHRIFVATLDARHRTLAVVPANYTATPGRIAELWLIPRGGKPLPLGLLPGDRIVTIAIPAAVSDQANTSAVLAVSLEPPGGSPTGQPTGPVIGSGSLTNL